MKAATSGVLVHGGTKDKEESIFLDIRPAFRDSFGTKARKTYLLVMSGGLNKVMSGVVESLNNMMEFYSYLAMEKKENPEISESLNDIAMTAHGSFIEGSTKAVIEMSNFLLTTLKVFDESELKEFREKFGKSLVHEILEKTKKNPIDEVFENLRKMGH